MDEKEKDLSNNPHYIEYEGVDNSIEEHHAYTAPEVSTLTDDWPRKVVILGAGGWGREVMQIILDIYLHDRSLAFLGFLDDNWEEIRNEKSYISKFILGPIEHLRERASQERIHYVLGVGFPEAKFLLAERAKECGYIPINAIHPKAIVLSRVKLGRGIVIQPGAIIAVDAILDDHCAININCSIGHDVHIGRFATISPLCAVSGFAEIREGAFLGSGAVVFSSCIVGEWAKVGALACVTKHVAPFSKVKGIPAKEDLR